ncbi:hypothetical protein Lesp02_02200 [Lentzea sp. NBRC 105346]|nr:hypothetical protein Lesp02_02200 [Lentzea sp. NBRC 105346]
MVEQFGDRVVRLGFGGVYVSLLQLCFRVTPHQRTALLKVEPVPLVRHKHDEQSLKAIKSSQ